MYRDSTPVLPANVLSRDFPITNYHPNCHSNYHAKHRTINTRISRICPSHVLSTCRLAYPPTARKQRRQSVCRSASFPWSRSD